MSSRPQNLDTVHLVLELLKRIPKRSKVSTSDLHKQLVAAGFDRDVRTIQRQLDELTTRFDIERDTRSKPYGYQWKESAGGMAVQQLSEQEALLLTLAEQQLRLLLPATVMRSMGGFFDEARATLRYGGESSGASGNAPAKLAKEWLKKVRVVSQTQPLLPPSINPAVLETVSQTLYDNHYLDVQYQNAKGGITQARVMPLGLAQQGVRLYLVCRFEGFENERSLALHRLQSATATGLSFDRPDDFSLEAFDNDGRFGFASGAEGGEFIDLHFRITQNAGLHLLETPLTHDQTVTTIGKPATHYEVRARLVKTQQLVWWLRGFGDAVEVLAPTGLLG